MHTKKYNMNDLPYNFIDVSPWHVQARFDFEHVSIVNVYFRCPKHKPNRKQLNVNTITLQSTIATFCIYINLTMLVIINMYAP